MNRKSAIRASLIGLPFLAFILYAALNWYTLEDESISIGAGETAREDPFLAYTRLLERMGAPASVGREPSSLDAPPPRGTLILGRRRLAYMTPARVSRIVRWVDAGGSLVMEPEGENIDDPLLDALGVERVTERDDKESRKNRGVPVPAGTSGAVSVDWPQLGRPLRVRLGIPPGLRDARVRSDVREVRQGERVIALTFASGEGRVTVMPGLGFLRNNTIGELDHAELGWRLASAQSPTLLYLRMQSPPFLDWVRRDAWPVALAGALLLVLWLGRIIPRFGPLEPAEEPPRRSLLEHIVASGRFLWSRGAGAYLLEAVRERALRVARRRGVATQAITAGATKARLDANTFTQNIASLQEFEERLERRKKGRP